MHTSRKVRYNVVGIALLKIGCMYCTQAEDALKIHSAILAKANMARAYDCLASAEHAFYRCDTGHDGKPRKY